MKLKITLLVLLISIAGLTGCLLDEETSDEQAPFQIVVVTDVHVRLPGNPDDGEYDNQKNLDTIQQAVDIINDNYSSADFVAVTGDLVGCLFSEDPDDYLTGDENPAETFKLLFDNLLPPYHVALGNHDYYTGFDPVIGEHLPAEDIDAVESIWKKVLNTDPYYSFVHKGIQMIFLNSGRGPEQVTPCYGLDVETGCKGSFDQEQMAWLERCLQRPEPALLFSHHPPGHDAQLQELFLFDIMGIDINDRFYQIVEQYRSKILAIFSGHWHLWQEYLLFDTIPVYQTGSLGDYFGSKRNISIVDIDPVQNRVQVSRYTAP